MFPAGAVWAAANDAVAANKWMLDIPDSSQMVQANGETIASSRFLPTRGGGQSLKRHQKVYMAFFDDSGDVHVNADGVVATCTEDNTCASAPLFISSESAMICTDGDIGLAAADNSNNIKVRVCMDSTCTAAKSVVWLSELVEASTNACGEGGHLSGYDSVNLGGQWIYVELTGAPDNGDEVLVWVVGL